MTTTTELVRAAAGERDDPSTDCDSPVNPMASLSLDWIGDLKFKNSDGSPEIELHSSTPGVTSPTQALAYAVMACMGMDVVHVLQKGGTTCAR